MDKLEALDTLEKLVENELVTNLKLIMESSYGILSNIVKEREIKRFKTQRLKNNYFTLLADDEVNTIIENILLKNGIKVNEKNITNSKAPELDER